MAPNVNDDLSPLEKSPVTLPEQEFIIRNADPMMELAK